MAKRSRRKQPPPGHVPPSGPSDVLPKPVSRTSLSVAGVALLLAITTFLVYAPSLRSDFVYDARKEILIEGFVTSLSNLPAILSFKVLSMNLTLGSRPGTLFYLMLIAAICGKQPLGYHLCSNLLHAANVALWFVVLLRLIKTELAGLTRSGVLRIQLAAGAVALIFALHPIAVESVAEVSYSSSLLEMFFTLLALLAAMAFRPKNLRNAAVTGTLGTLCAFAAVTCKESGMIAALLLVVYWFLFRRGEAKAPWLIFLGAATTATALFLAVRFLFVSPIQHNPHYLGGSFSQVLLIQPHLWVFMMGKLLWPTQLSADYVLADTIGLSTPLAFLILAIVVGGQTWLATKSRLGALGMAFYWLALITVSNFMPLYRPLADRFYYMPLAGMTMELLALLLMIKSRPGFWMAWVSCLGVLVPLPFLTVSRELVFANEFSLWSDTLQASPLSSTAQNNFGKALVEKGRKSEAMVYFQKALEINPTDPEALLNVGIALANRGKAAEAMAKYQRALEINPNYAEAYNDLGNVLFQQGKVDEAMARYEKALEISPNMAEANYNLGHILLQKGLVDEAIVYLQKSLEIDPVMAGSHYFHYYLGEAFFKKGRIDEAIAQFNKTLEIDPTMAEAHDALAHALLQKGQVDEAMAQLQKALEINPNSASFHYNLGNILSQKGRMEEAVDQFKKALEIDPSHVDIHNSLGIALAKKGELDLAIIQFQESLRLKPDDQAAEKNLVKAQA